MYDTVTHEGDAGTGDNTPDWKLAHDELLRLSHERARIDFVEGHWLVQALRSGAHRHLGYASFSEYIERLFGYSPRWTAEKLRVAEELESLPSISRALTDGELSWSSARELTRVATAETESEWLACSRGRTARDIERLVSGHIPGNRPHDTRDPMAERHVLRFEVSGEVFAAIREAFAQLRRDAGGPLDDDGALLLMARRVLGGPSDPRQSSYQTALTVCERCRSGTVEGSGDAVRVERDIVEMAACDATSFAASSKGDTHVGRAGRRTKQSIPRSTRRLVHQRDGGRCRVPGCRHAVYVDVHHIAPKAEGGSHDPENLVTLCSAHHRALHRGELVAEGRASSALTFRHADGSSYGAPHVSPAAAVARATAFRALVSLGFREGEARRALERLSPHVGHEASAESVLRQALAELTHPKSSRANGFGPKAA
jgi:5-methylcytosine-specific restriction endonuclease McrA